MKLNGELWLDDAARLKSGDTVEVLANPIPAPKLIDNIVIRHIDEHLVVVEKPSGISTVRHPAEKDWLEDRRLLTSRSTTSSCGNSAWRCRNKSTSPGPGCASSIGIDKETSGLVVFARTVEAERGLGTSLQAAP